jgi:hypothetical protein
MLVPRISRFTPLNSFIQLGGKPKTSNPAPSRLRGEKTRDEGRDQPAINLNADVRR